METSRVPNKLKSLRRQFGYSRKKMARLFGHADTSTLSRWERGLAVPGLLQAFQLAKVYGVLPHELFAELWNVVGRDKSLLAIEPFNINEPVYL